MPVVFRRDEPGACHHVINRAVGRRPFFEEPEEIRYFLSLLARAVRRGWIEVHVFAILASHFHLLVRSLNGELHAAMAWVQSRYVARFNLKYGRDGPLVRGRFFSKRVDDPVYRNTVIGYIDWNPVAAGFAPSPFEFEHGSAHLLLRPRRPKWLSTAWTVDRICRNSPDGSFDKDAYAAMYRPSSKQVELVEQRLRHPGYVENSSNLVRATGPAVEAWLRERARVADGDARRDAPLAGPDAVQQAIRGLASERIPPAPRRDADRRRPMAVGLLRQLSGLSFAEIAARMGVSRGRASALWGRHRDLVAADAAYSHCCAELTSELLQSVTK